LYDKEIFILALISSPRSSTALKQLSTLGLDMKCDNQGPQFSSKCGILSRAAEFAHFSGISMFSQNFVEFGTGRRYRGQIRHILVEFRPPYTIS